LERLNTVIRQESEHWRWMPVVKPLMSLRGVDFLTAMTIVAEIGHLKRFDHPRKLMSFLGLEPCEFSSGASKQRGSTISLSNRFEVLDKGHASARELLQPPMSIPLPLP